MIRFPATDRQAKPWSIKMTKNNNIGQPWISLKSKTDLVDESDRSLDNFEMKYLEIKKKNNKLI